MHSIIVDLVITGDEYVKQYRHYSAVVSTNSRDGRRVKFPANILQPFVSHAGIRGSFNIHFDDQGKYMAIEKLPET